MTQRRNSRRGPRRSGARNPDIKKERQVEWELPCPVCGEPIYEIASAITDRVSGNPAHFECIMKRLAEEEELAEDEKVCYLGNGSFGIIQKKNNNQAKFTIRKRIQYEEKDAISEWRRGLRKTDAHYRKNERHKK